MRHLLWPAIGVAATAAFVQIASAADLPVKAAPAPPAPIANWTGFYIGGHLGGAWGPDVAQSWVEGPGPSTEFPRDPVSFGRASTSNVIGGVQAGYNWQVAPYWLLGVEGDFSWTSLSVSQTQSPMTRSGVPLLPTSFVTMSNKVDWLSSIRGRVGYLWGGNWMGYVTGGVGFEHQHFFGNSVFPNTAFFGSTAFNNVKTGWVGGAGVEYLATRNWMLRLEYLYYGFEGTSSTVIQSTLAGPGTGNPLQFSWSHNNVQVVRAGIGYKF